MHFQSEFRDILYFGNAETPESQQFPPLPGNLQATLSLFFSSFPLFFIPHSLLLQGYPKKESRNVATSRGKHTFCSRSSLRLPRKIWPSPLSCATLPSLPSFSGVPPRPSRVPLIGTDSGNHTHTHTHSALRERNSGWPRRPRREFERDDGRATNLILPSTMSPTMVLE